MVSWDSYGALFAGSILGTRGAHMEPDHLDDSRGLVVPHMGHYPWDDLDSQGALSPGCFRFGHDGHSQDTLIGHVSLDSMSADVALDMTSSTYEEEVQMLGGHD